MPIYVPWSRLIRFIGEEDGLIHFGDAIAPVHDFDIGARQNVLSLKAKVISGDPFKPDCQVTDKILNVKRLLGPLTSDTVPALRCIGGNYEGHRQ